MQNYEKILVLSNEVQAELMDALLTERDIPHVLQCYHDSALDGLFQNTKGWGHIEAPGDCREEILAMFEEVKHQHDTPPADADADTDPDAK